LRSDEVFVEAFIERQHVFQAVCTRWTAFDKIDGFFNFRNATNQKKFIYSDTLHEIFQRKRAVKVDSTVTC